MPNSPFTNIDVTTANVGLDGTKIDLCKFLDEEASQIFNEALKQIDTTTLDQGAYPLRLGKTKTFAENQLIINGDDIAELRLDVSVSLLVHKPCRGDEIA